MATILSSSDSAPVSSVMIYWNTIVITLNMLFRDKLFTLWVWNYWLGTCWLCLKGGWAFISPSVLRQVCATGCGSSYCCCSVLLCTTTAKDSPGVLWLEENTLPDVVLGVLCNFLFHILSLAWLQPQQSRGWGSSLCINLARVWRLPEPSDIKTVQDSEPRLIVLARKSSNLAVSQSW
jgi:hypothetical protein